MTFWVDLKTRRSNILPNFEMSLFSLGERSININEHRWLMRTSLAICGLHWDFKIILGHFQQSRYYTIMKWIFEADIIRYWPFKECSKPSLRCVQIRVSRAKSNLQSSVFLTIFSKSIINSASPRSANEWAKGEDDRNDEDTLCNLKFKNLKTAHMFDPALSHYHMRIYGGGSTYNSKLTLNFLGFTGFCWLSGFRKHKNQ